MTSRQLVSSGAVWEPVVGYSRAVRVGPWVAVAGTTAAAAGRWGRRRCTTRPPRPARRCAASPWRSSRSAPGLEHVVRTRIFVTDISRWEEVGRVHGEVFGDVRPASTMVEVSRLIDPALLVEVEADAVVPCDATAWPGRC